MMVVCRERYKNSKGMLMIVKSVNIAARRRGSCWSSISNAWMGSGGGGRWR